MKPKIVYIILLLFLCEIFSCNGEEKLNIQEQKQVDTKVKSDQEKSDSMLKSMQERLDKKAKEIK